MFELLLSQRPQFGTGYNDLAALLIRQNRLEEAKPLLERALLLLPEPHEKAAVHANLGMLFAQTPDLQSSLKHLTAAIRVEPVQFVSLNAKLGEALWRLGRPGEAVEVCDGAIKAMEASKKVDRRANYSTYVHIW